ncbi:hypothetical protein BDF19DRAFT_420336 [Syncephalis fuscata]|nr:hypothetical protein BDF19DRAFT_420336 [Syncephalis fuscata]
MAADPSSTTLRRLSFLLCLQRFLLRLQLSNRYSVLLVCTINQIWCSIVQEALTPQTIVGAIIALAAGFVLCFFGYRFFRPTLFLAGFAIAAFVVYVACLNIAPLKGDDMDSINAPSVCFWRFGLLLIGALGGLVGGLFILAFMPNGLIQEPIWKLPVVIVATAAGGGFALALGIDFFVQASSAVLSFDAKTYIMLALVAIFAILGMIVQFRFFKGVFGNGKPATDTSNRQDNA